MLVGLPTLNHADTVAASVRAAHVAFDGHFARERTVLLNVDGGSSDGTTEVVREASFLEGETLLASFSLRTRHRISAPYHGVPGKASGIRTIFAAADLLQARAVAVLDPEVTSVTPDSLAMLLRPVMADEIDFVSPAYARHPLDGALVTQLVRPLFRSTYGLRLREPLAGEFACSGRFAARCLELKAWESEHLRVGIDLWLSTVAATGPYRVGEARLGPRQLAPRARPGVAALVPQVLDALFTCLRLARGGLDRARRRRLRLALRASPCRSRRPRERSTPRRDASVFREGVRALEPILARALEPATLEAVRAAAAASGPRRAVGRALGCGGGRARRRPPQGGPEPRPPRPGRRPALPGARRRVPCRTARAIPRTSSSGARGALPSIRAVAARARLALDGRSEVNHGRSHSARPCATPGAATSTRCASIAAAPAVDAERDRGGLADRRGRADRHRAPARLAAAPTPGRTDRGRRDAAQGRAARRRTGSRARSCSGCCSPASCWPASTRSASDTLSSAARRRLALVPRIVASLAILAVGLVLANVVWRIVLLGAVNAGWLVRRAR